MNHNKDENFQNLILFGPNGCGKTTYLNNIIEKNKKEKNIFIYNKESLKDSYDSKTNSFKKAIDKKQNELTKIIINEKNPIDKSKYLNYINEINSKIVNLNDSKVNEVLIKNQLEISFEFEKIDKFFKLNSFILLNGKRIELEKAPSGVKQIISLKYEIDKKIKDEKKSKNFNNNWWIWQSFASFMNKPYL